MRYFLISCMVFMSVPLGHAEDSVIPKKINNSQNFDLIELMVNRKNFQVAVELWKDERLEEAWDIFTKLEVEITNPNFLAIIFLSKAIIAQELGRHEEVDNYYLPYIYTIYREELEKIDDKEERVILERQLIVICMLQANTLKERIFHLNHSN